MNYIISALIGIAVLVGGVFTVDKVRPDLTVGAFSDPFLSIQLATSPSNGDCLSTDGTNNIWDTCAAGGGGSGGGTWSTTTSQTAGQFINYPNNATDIVNIGSNSTTTGEWWFDPNLNIGNTTGKIGIGTTSPYLPLSVAGSAVIGDNVRAGYFTATTSTASTFPYASTTYSSHSGGFAIAQNGTFASGELRCTGLKVSTEIGCYRGDGGMWLYNTSNGAGMYGTGFPTGDTQLFTIPSGTTKVVALTVEGANSASNGFIGVGTSTPYARLSVVGETVASHFTATTTNTNTFGGSISFDGELMPDGATCSDGQILKKTGANNWDCSADDTSAGGGTFPFIVDPNFNQAANSTSTQIWFKGSPIAISASSTSVFTNASTTQLTVTSSAWFTSLTSAIIQAGSDGLLAEYAGTSCTNQFVRSLSALGVATCATVGSADVSLANLTATDATLTFSGTYNGSTARTIGLNLGNANTWTALQQFNANASTTVLSVSQNGTATTTILSNATSTFAGPIQDKSVKSITFNVTSITAAGDFGRIWKTPRAITIQQVIVNQEGATNVIGQLQECDNNGANCTGIDSSDITGTNGVDVTDDGTLSNPSVDAQDYIGWDTTSVSGTNTRVSITFKYVESF